jgi:hypothetical protein
MEHRIYTRQEKLRLVGLALLAFTLVYLLCRLAGIGWELGCWW